MQMLAFLFGWWVFRPYSIVIASILRLKGIQVGKEFYIQGVPYLKIRGRPENVVIGDNVEIFGDIDIRNREDGRIVISDGVKFDEGCRLVSANEAVLMFHTGAEVGARSIFNCGASVTVGENALFGGYCYVQSSNHGMKRSAPIRDQPYTHAPIVIERNAWLAGHVSVMPGVTIGEGAVVGAKAVVTKDIDPFVIAAGIPARAVKSRVE